MDVSDVLKTKQFYRFTGPPEHWLTALKYWTWGLEEHNRSQWQKVQTGDVFFIHSTGAQNSAFPNAKSGIIGIGVVGFNFSKKDNSLWHYEIKNNVNRWPLLIPLTEIYLFSEIPDPATWESPEPKNDNQTAKLIDQLVNNRVPISEVKGFPQMGSFSKVSFGVAEQILFQNRPLYLYSGHSKRGEIKDEDRPSDMTEAHTALETLRHAASLRFLPEISRRIISKPYSLVTRDNEILARADLAHLSVMQQLLDIFRAKGYDTWFNEYVDLFAHNDKKSFLFEVKSNENKNFRVQARKGIAQLFEYDYFEINKYKKEKNIEFQNQYKVLALSKEPKDEKYIEFINSLNLGVTTVESNVIKPIGKDLGFSGI